MQECRLRRRDLWALSFSPGFWMAWDQDPGTCFFWKPTSWISTLFSSLCNYIWPLPRLVPAVPCTRAFGQQGKRELKFCPLFALQAICLAWTASTREGTKAPHGLVWPCHWVPVLSQSSLREASLRGERPASPPPTLTCTKGLCELLEDQPPGFHRERENPESLAIMEWSAY